MKPSQHLKMFLFFGGVALIEFKHLTLFGGRGGVLL